MSFQLQRLNLVSDNFFLLKQPNESANEFLLGNGPSVIRQVKLAVGLVFYSSEC